MIKFNGNFIGRLDPTLKDTKTAKFAYIFLDKRNIMMRNADFFRMNIFFCLFVCLSRHIDRYLYIDGEGTCLEVS